MSLFLRLAPRVDGGAHAVGGGLQHEPSRGFVDVAEPAPRRCLGVPQRFSHPHVSDAGDEFLVLKRLAEGACLVGRAKAGEHLVDVGWCGEDVGPEPRERACVEFENGAAVEHSLPLARAQDEPRSAGDLVGAAT